MTQRRPAREQLLRALEGAQTEKAIRHPPTIGSTCDPEIGRLREQIAALQAGRELASARAFWQAVLAITFGIAMPCGCLFLDPKVVTANNGLLGNFEWLSQYAHLGYMGLVLEMACLCVWLLARPLPAFFAGVFAVGAFAFLVLGVIHLPIIGLELVCRNGAAMIGIWPLATGCTYGWVAYETWMGSRRSAAGPGICLTAGEGVGGWTADGGGRARVGSRGAGPALAKGDIPRTPTRLKYGLLLSVALGVLGLGIAATRKSAPPAQPAAQEGGRLGAAPVRPPAAAPAELDEVTVATTPSFISNRIPETVRISADRTCVYEVQGLPARGEAPAWSGARIVHKLPATRLRELNELLKGTNWLEKAPEERPLNHYSRCEITLKRKGKTTRLVLTGPSEPYAKLTTFFNSVATQEYLLYRLGWVPPAMIEARRELDSLIPAELREPKGRPLLAIDLTRYIPWATRIVRNPFDRQADDVRTAVRLVGWLKLESEREYLADLANDRDRRVREVVAQAVRRLGGAKAVPVLRKMVRSTGAEAAWELIQLGPVAVPAIAEVIREGKGPEEDMSYEWLIRAYIEHWKEVPKPLDPKVLAAVRANMEVPGVKALRTYYHAELLKLAAGAERKE